MVFLPRKQYPFIDLSSFRKKFANASLLLF
jgi:hypothetical protein